MMFREAIVSSKESTLKTPHLAKTRGSTQMKQFLAQ
jgi:hypothetical protein